ncbi:ABC transporter permease YtrF precursor [Paraliobacillus sp. PM-2]|uniref:ABC transporter permease n=1 Tax=Paraliobacillus sp. PM-2 TaxID=1462524 RepID=UPI00061C3383|nr:FtsX-like permease family protein [Paraliobacillus sp. PM-2]CQR48289.1 ABC transporter permease YtrF precursor [Paraliobacillus sp. PM-2]
MRIRDQFRFVKQNMKKNKMRVFMTVLATAMGCAFLIVIASVPFGLHQTFVKDLLQQDTINEINVQGIETDEGYQPITEKDIKNLRQFKNVKAVTFKSYIEQPTTFSIDNYKLETGAMAVDFNAERNAGISLEDGTFPSKENEVLVGYHFATQLFPTDTDKEEELYNEKGKLKEAYQYQKEIIGQTFQMTVTRMNKDGEEETKEIPITIAGIMEEPARDWMMDTEVRISESLLHDIEQYTGTPNGQITIPNENIENEKHYANITVYSYSLEQVQTLTEKLEDNNYLVYSVASSLNQLNMIFTIAKAGLIFIGTIAILIASIGIYNTMTMAVTERAPDIGIMKAIGANPKVIKRIFLLESSYIGLLGAVIGTIIAYMISLFVNFVIPIIIQSAFQEELPEGFKFSAIPATLVIIAIAICLIVTIISGSRPAKKATRIDILKAMRREI